MSAPGQVNGPIKDAIKYLKDAGDIAAEYKLKLAIEFNSQHDVLNSLRVLTELIEGGDKPNCGYLIDAYHFTPQRRRRSRLRKRPADKIFASSTAICHRARSPAFAGPPIGFRLARAWFNGARCWGWPRKTIPVT
jgi:hypothetical protein